MKNKIRRTRRFVTCGRSEGSLSTATGLVLNELKMKKTDELERTDLTD